MTIKEIASRIGLGKRTIQRWVTFDSYPETRYHIRRHRSRFDAYEAYVRQRWDKGCHNIQQIWREIRAQGYLHSDRAFRGHLESVCGKTPTELPAAGVLGHFSAKEAVWLFLRPFEKLKKNEQEELLAMRQASETMETLYQLAQGFASMVRQRQGERLEAWLSKVRACPITELYRFANGLERDKAAVLVGVTCIHNKGQVEGK